MNLKTAIKYHISDMMPGIVIYYIVMFIINIFMSGTISIESHFADQNSYIYSSTGSTELITVIALFIIGLNSFKDNFRMFLQNGRSRKSLISSFAITAVIFSILATSLEFILGRLQTGIMKAADSMSNAQVTVEYQNLIKMMFFDRAIYKGEDVNETLMWLQIIVWLFVLFLAVLLGAYMLSIMYYRMNKALKIIVFISVPAAIFIILPSLAINFDFINQFLVRLQSGFIRLFFGEISISIVSILVSCLILLGISYLLVNRVDLKNESE